ncbi:NUMOD4 motif-containing HNH endonuclease, partial [bacterium]|nr:NUMOD4 motif-containing HNH endonuclease [bacterium]
MIKLEKKGLFMEWRDVVGYEGIYMVSSTGLVKSVARPSKPRHINDYIRNLKQRYLTISTSKGNYLRVSISGRTKFIHLLVMEALMGDKPHGHECDHIDDDPTNNNLSNLRYITRKANKMKASKKSGQRGV